MATEQVLHPFGGLVNVVGQQAQSPDGLQPEGDVTLSNDGTTLYGRTYTGGPPDSTNMFAPGDGTIFSINISQGANDTIVASNYQTLHNFAGEQNSLSPDGANPRHNAMALSADGTTLYGMTVAGGAGQAVPNVDGDGVVFSYNLTLPVANAYTILHNWGVTPNDGAVSHGSLFLDDATSTMYGMTEQGGAQGKGILFAMSTNGLNEDVLWTFGQDSMGNKTDAFGTEPHATPNLVSFNGDEHLYGMTRKGGVAPDGTELDDGVLYDYDLTRQTMTVLHTFGTVATNDGATPFHGIPQFQDGVLYGMTTDGGQDAQGQPANNGIVFSYDLNPGDPNPYKVLHYFQGEASLANDGVNPDGSVTVIGNKLYGVTTGGGTHNQGIFFSMNLDGSDYQIPFNFYDTAGTSVVPAVTEGAHPIDSLTPQVHPDGSITFYGLTQEGGTADSSTNPHGAGVIFAITLPSSSSAPAAALSTSVNLQQVQVTPGLGAEAVALTAQVASPGVVVGEGTVTFSLAGQAVSAAVNGNGRATASLSLPALSTARPQTVTVSYSDPAGTFAASSAGTQVPFILAEAVLPSTTSFDAAGAATVTDTLFALFSLTRSYNAPGQLTAVSLGGLPLITFQYNSQGQLTLILVAGLPWEVRTYNAQGQLTSVSSPLFTSVFFYNAQGQLIGSVRTNPQGQVTTGNGGLVSG
jgi:uncharacterized repeat protein (TIGR03803 family)/YD repeat-containing protein